LGGGLHTRHSSGHICIAGRQLRVLSRHYAAPYGRAKSRLLLQAAGEPAGDEGFERDAERLMGQLGGDMDEEEAGQILDGLEGFDEESLRNLDQFPELMGADNIGNQDEAEEGEYADSLRIPTPSSEASTSGSDPDGDKYPPQPERGYHAHELFDKAALEEVADYLREKFPEACLFGLQSEIERVLPGDLYCCEPMDLDDVPDLVQRAVQAQAAAVLLPEQAYHMSSVRESVPEDFPVLYAGDVSELSQRLAVAFYDAPSRDLLVVGVTGSHGKTTVSWLIRGMLEEMEQVTGMIGSVEYAIAEDRLDEDGELWVPREEDPAADRESSVPFMVTPYAGKYTVPATTPPGLQVQKLLAGVRDRGGTCAVVECSSYAMANRELDWLEVGVVVHTRLSLSAESSPKMQQQLRAELALFEKLYDPTTQAAVINLDDPAADLVKASASAVPVVTYGIDNPDADVYAETAKMDIWESEVIVRTPLGKLQIITPLLGKHNVYNILAAVATGICLKIPLKSIVAGIEAVEVVPGRSELIDEGQGFSVIVDAADTPEAVDAMLSALAGKAKNILTVIGCRGQESRAPRPYISEVVHAKSDLVIFTNDSPRQEPPEQIIQDMVAGLPEDLVSRYSGYVYFPFQDQGHVPLWFEPYLQRAQRTTKRYVMEDRFSAIRAAIGTAGPGDVVVILGRGHKDYMEYGAEDDTTVLGWFDDRVEARSALSKLTYLDQLSDLSRNKLPWGSALDDMETVIDPPPTEHWTTSGSV